MFFGCKSSPISCDIQGFPSVLAADSSIFPNVVVEKNSKNCRSDVIHKITHSNPTPFKSYTLPILHSSNPTPFQLYILTILLSSNLSLLQSHTNTPTHQHINTPTHQRTNTSSQYHTNTPTPTTIIYKHYHNPQHPNP